MQRVFSRKRYILIAVVAGLLVFLALNAAPVIPLFGNVTGDTSLMTSTKLSFIYQLLAGIFENVDTNEILYSVTLSILVGMNISLLVFYRRMYGAQRNATNFATGFSGGVAALFGFGCGACGSIFASALFSGTAGSGLLAALPFGGSELSYAGIVLIVFSCVSLVRSINKPVVCPI